jgi:pimeloyl-ACP methyl ester carboxylesterase
MNIGSNPDGLVPLPRPVWLNEGLWPFETSSLTVEGCRIAVTDIGRGPALLFVHTGFWSFIWRDVMLRLAEDFRCVCFDAPGTGRSDRLPVERISLRKAARALTAVVEALNLSDTTLVFHDLGGPSGLAGGSRVAGRISGLCAVNTFGWKPDGNKFRFMLALMGSSPIRELSVRSGALTRITAGNFGVGMHLDDASREAFLAGIGPQGVRAFHGYLRDARDSPIYEEVESALTGVFRNLPLITIFGERNDPLEFQPRWKSMFPAAEQIVVRKGNHFPMCDDPDLVAATIRRWHRNEIVPRAASRQEAHSEPQYERSGV